MDWMDFNRDGEVDAAEMYLAEELICSSKEEHEALFGDAGDFEDDEYEEDTYYKINYCPFCGEPIEISVVGE